MDGRETDAVAGVGVEWGPGMGADRLQCLCGAAPHGLHAHPQALHGHLGGQSYQLRRTAVTNAVGLVTPSVVGHVLVEPSPHAAALEAAAVAPAAAHPKGWDEWESEAAPPGTAALTPSLPPSVPAERGLCLGVPTPPENGIVQSGTSKLAIVP